MTEQRFHFGPKDGLRKKIGGSDFAIQTHLTVFCSELSDLFEEMLRKADVNIERGYPDSQKASKGLSHEALRHQTSDKFE